MLSEAEYIWVARKVICGQITNQQAITELVEASNGDLDYVNAAGVLELYLVTIDATQHATHMREGTEEFALGQRLKRALAERSAVDPGFSDEDAGRALGLDASQVSSVLMAHDMHIFGRLGESQFVPLANSSFLSSVNVPLDEVAESARGARERRTSEAGFAPSGAESSSTPGSGPVGGTQSGVPPNVVPFTRRDPPTRPGNGPNK